MPVAVKDGGGEQRLHLDVPRCCEAQQRGVCGDGSARLGPVGGGGIAGGAECCGTATRQGKGRPSHLGLKLGKCRPVCPTDSHSPRLRRTLPYRGIELLEGVSCGGKGGTALRRCRPRGQCLARCMGMLAPGRARAAEPGWRPLRPRAGGSIQYRLRFGWADGWMAVVAFKKGLGHGQKGWVAASRRPRCWEGMEKATLGVGQRRRVALLCLLKWLRWDAVQRALQCMLPGLRFEAKGSWIGGC